MNKKYKTSKSFPCEFCNNIIEKGGYYFKTSSNMCHCKTCAKDLSKMKTLDLRHVPGDKQHLYRTVPEIMKAVKRLGIKGTYDYTKRYTLDPRLPSRPDKIPGFVSVSYQLNKRKKKKVSNSK